MTTTHLFQQNLARFSTWLARPDTSSPISSRADKDLAPRGAAWALLRYTADQFAPNNARAFFRRLVAGPETGVTNLVQHAGVPFDQIISGWLISNYTDNLGISGLDARYSYTSWNMRDAVAGWRAARTAPRADAWRSRLDDGAVGLRCVFPRAARLGCSSLDVPHARSEWRESRIRRARVYIVRVN
jgi:hypothetical protein